MIITALAVGGALIGVLAGIVLCIAAFGVLGPIIFGIILLIWWKITTPRIRKTPRKRPIQVQRRKQETPRIIPAVDRFSSIQPIKLAPTNPNYRPPSGQDSKDALD